ncbi:MAG TPA: glycosyltransferase family 4 protein [Pseudolabrys sp.]|nr:glycosyltransferase family 4 protein [Pseudolabrys sp.]
MIICVAGLRGVPRVLGGVETHCEQLFPRLQKLRSNDSFTIIARRGYVAEQISEYGGVRVVALPHSRSRYFETISNTIGAVFYAKFVAHADLLHLHGIGPALTAPFAKALGMKVISTYHSRNYEQAKWNMVARAALRMGEMCAVFFSDHIIAVSPWMTEDLKRRFPISARKIHFIPNGADHLLDRESVAHSTAAGLLASYGLEKNKYMLTAGRLVPEKGFHDLIKAFEATDLGLKLVIAGDANQKDAYSRSLLSLASDRIVFTGILSPPALHALLQHASLFVLPSHNEGMPIIALEAIAAGAPVLLSDIPSNLDLKLGSQNYFKVRDIENLRLKLAGDHGRLRVPREQIVAKYNWDAICAETNSVYGAALRDSPAIRSGPRPVLR